jgi:hypothetical protein
MAFIFGSNPDSLAQQRMGTDQMNIGFAERQQALAQSEQDRANQQQIDADNRARDEQAQEFQFGAQQAAQQKASAENDYRFNLGRQDEAAATAESKRRFDIGAKQTQQQIDASTGQSDYAEAVNAVENGDVTSLADLTKSFPKLTPSQQQRAAMYLTMKTRKQGQDYQSVMAAANAATGLVTPKPVTTTVKPHFWSSPVTTTTPATPLTEDEAFAKLATVKPLAKFLPALTWDEQSQKFLPAIPKPEGWQPTQTSGSGTGPGTPPNAQAAPASAPAPFSFNATAAPQPTTVTSGTQPLSGGVPNLVAGQTVYKGYRYVGGDPGAQTSWVPANQ